MSIVHFITLTLIVVSSTAVHAQQLAPSAVGASSTAPVLLRMDSQRLHNDEALFSDGAIRLVFAAAGSVVGAYAGAADGIARSKGNHCDGPCFDGLGEAMIGSALVAGILASAPTMSSHCGVVKRMTYGLLGSAAGSAVAFAAGRALAGPLFIFAPLVGATMGATAGAELCRGDASHGAASLAF